MTIEELGELLNMLREQYDPKWYVCVLTQFLLGMRASEVLSIQLWDFKNDFSKLDYRQAKTNKIISDEPVPSALRLALISYIVNNLHRFKNGYLFSKDMGNGIRIVTTVYGAFWAKWRKACAKRFGVHWVDRYDIPNGQRRYRICSHSLRRLHRTSLTKNVESGEYNKDWLISQICHYDDFKTFLKYKNEFEVLEARKEFIEPALQPVISRVLGMSKGQTSISDF